MDTFNEDNKVLSIAKSFPIWIDSKKKKKKTEEDINEINDNLFDVRLTIDNNEYWYY